MTVPFDPRALSAPVDAATAKAFRAHLGRTGRLPGGSGAAGWVIGVFAVVIGVFVIGGTMTSIFMTLASAISGGGGMPGAGAASVLLAIVPVVIIAVIAIVTVLLVRSGRGTQAATWYRLDRFATANAMTFEPQRAAPPLPGMIFSQGDARMATHLVRGDRPRFVEFANYRYSTGSGKNRTTHRWGYVAVHLSTPLPHIVLDAVGNNGLLGSNLPVSFRGEQHLSLEGDFDRYFRLYCPSGYETDALYLFTPDVMARFVDHAAALDVEIVDDWMFFYAKRDLVTLDPATWAWLFGAVAAMLDKLAQWERWRDDRLAAQAEAQAAASGAALPATLPTAPAPGAVGAPLPPPALPVVAPPGLLRPPPGVALPGRRLRTRFPWPALVLIGVVVVVTVVVPFVSTLIGIASTLP